MSNLFLEVAVNLPINSTFYYSIQEDQIEKAKIGKRIKVPFNNREATGYIVGFKDNTEIHDIKEIISIDEEEFFDEKMLKFYRWISDYYFSPLGEVIAASIPSYKSLKRINVEDYNPDDIRESPIKLNDEQKVVMDEIRKGILSKKFCPFLLHGVTGSGKTEIYIQAIKEVIDIGKKGIILVPEISLTHQLISRFEKRFGNRIAVLHSALSQKIRYKEWLRIKNGYADVAIGVRSAIFAPFKDIGIIIVDEEHDSSYKQEEGVRYNARDLALIRGKIWNSVVILGSATPSIESFYNAINGKYRYLRLKNRVEGRPLPDVEIVDMKDSSKNILSERLKTAINRDYSNGKQIMLFLNRRGFSPFILCIDCGYVIKCPNCSISLTFHLNKKILLCHYCNFSTVVMSLCPNCKGIRLKGYGIGIEMVEEEIKKLFPSINIDRLDRDSISKKGALNKILTKFERGETNILVGTQMITKGHDYHNVTLVGIISADTSLNIPDFRSSEKTFQLITQFSGRAGRGITPGNVIIQTFNPDHYSILCAKDHDYYRFYKEEIKFRKELNYPPFSRLINFKIIGKNEEKTKEIAIDVGNIAKMISKRYSKDINILGPSPAPIAKIKGKYRWQLLVKGRNRSSLYGFSSDFLDECHKKRSAKIIIDVDPMNLL